MNFFFNPHREARLARFAKSGDKTPERQDTSEEKLIKDMEALKAENKELREQIAALTKAMSELTDELKKKSNEEDRPDDSKKNYQKMEEDFESEKNNADKRLNPEKHLKKADQANNKVDITLDKAALQTKQGPEQVHTFEQEWNQLWQTSSQVGDRFKANRNRETGASYFRMLMKEWDFITAPETNDLPEVKNRKAEIWDEVGLIRQSGGKDFDRKNIDQVIVSLTKAADKGVDYTGSNENAAYHANKNLRDIKNGKYSDLERDSLYQRGKQTFNNNFERHSDNPQEQSHQVARLNSVGIERSRYNDQAEINDKIIGPDLDTKDIFLNDANDGAGFSFVVPPEYRDASYPSGEVVIQNPRNWHDGMYHSASGQDLAIKAGVRLERLRRSDGHPNGVRLHFTKPGLFTVSGEKFAVDLPDQTENQEELKKIEKEEADKRSKTKETLSEDKALKEVTIDLGEDKLNDIRNLKIRIPNGDWVDINTDSLKGGYPVHDDHGISVTPVTGWGNIYKVLIFKPGRYGVQAEYSHRRSYREYHVKESGNSAEVQKINPRNDINTLPRPTWRSGHFGTYGG